jgi:UDP-N-acetylmuramoylalanine-D-glutamate ligase
MAPSAAFPHRVLLLHSIFLCVWHTHGCQQTHHCPQVELTRATNVEAAASALDRLPAARGALLSLGSGASNQLSAFGEAFEYTLGELERKGSARISLEEQAQNTEELKSRQELKEADAEQWDAKYSRRKRRDNQK